jgi:isocitrate/isopropylmalate dehydrogenase
MGSVKGVVAIPGEDAAAEVFDAAMSLLDDLSLDLDWMYPPVGAGAIQTHGFGTPLAQPEGIDLVVVRENLEDLYVVSEGAVEDLAPLELQSMTWQKPVADLGPGAYALKVITERGCERVARFAFALARRRRAEGRPGKVTRAAKHNMLARTRPVAGGCV